MRKSNCLWFSELFPEDSQVRWCLHALFYLLCDNETNKMEAVHTPGFEASGICTDKQLAQLIPVWSRLVW